MTIGRLSATGNVFHAPPSLAFFNKSEHFPVLESVNTSPKRPRGICEPWAQRDKLRWLCLFQLGLSSVPERCNDKQTTKSALFFTQLFKLTFEEKATRNAILGVEIGRFSDCLTYLNQRTVK